MSDKPSHICCPYDGMECGDRRIVFEAWAEHVRECAKKQIDYMFHMSNEAYCSRASDEETRKQLCYRYRVYLAKQNKNNGR